MSEATNNAVVLDMDHLKKIGSEFDFDKFQIEMQKLKYPIIKKELIRSILVSLSKFYSNKFEDATDPIDIRSLELKSPQFIENLRQAYWGLGGYSTALPSHFMEPYEVICSLLADKVEILLKDLLGQQESGELINWNQNLQNEYNKPDLDQSAQVLLAKLLMENGAFLKEIKKGDVAKGMYLLSGYKINNFRNMLSPGQWDIINSAHPRRQVEKLIQKITSRLNELKKEDS